MRSLATRPGYGAPDPDACMRRPRHAPHLAFCHHPLAFWQNNNDGFKPSHPDRANGWNRRFSLISVRLGGVCLTSGQRPLSASHGNSLQTVFARTACGRSSRSPILPWRAVERPQG
jgi:hypothetical protein